MPWHGNLLVIDESWRQFLSVNLAWFWLLLHLKNPKKVSKDDYSILAEKKMFLPKQFSLKKSRKQAEVRSQI